MSEPPLVIRRGRPTDSAALADLGWRGWGDTHRDAFTPEDLQTALERDWTGPVIAAELADAATQVFVGERGGRTVGMCTLRPGSIPGDEHPSVELCRLYIESDQLGTGLGAALVDATLEAADRSEHDRCWLIAWERNDRALALYERRGFRRASTLAYEVGSSAPTAVVMVRARPGSVATAQP